VSIAVELELEGERVMEEGEMEDKERDKVVEEEEELDERAVSSRELRRGVTVPVLFEPSRDEARLLTSREESLHRRIE
jgi:hypothetical protein